MNNVLKEITDFQNHLSTLKEFIITAGEDKLQEVAKSVFEEVEGLNKFVILGYTPNFNDGEPCTHEGLYGFGNYIWLESYSKNGEYFVIGDDVGEFEEVKEFFELEEDYTIGSHAKDVNYVNKGVTDQQAVYKLLKHLSFVCEMLYETNYIIYFSKEDGLVKVNKEDYWCGY